jgi:hypothetical protein
MNKNLRIFIILVIMLAISLVAFVFFRWWLKRDLRRVMVAYLTTYGVSTAVVGDEESQQQDRTAKAWKGNNIPQKGKKRSPQGKVWQPAKPGTTAAGKGKQNKAEVFEMSGANGNGKGKSKDKGNGQVQKWVQTSPVKNADEKTASAKPRSAAASDAGLMGILGEPQWYGGGN